MAGSLISSTYPHGSRDMSLSSVFVSNQMFFVQSVAKMNAYFDLLEVDHLKVTSFGSSISPIVIVLGCHSGILPVDEFVGIHVTHLNCRWRDLFEHAGLLTA